MSTPSEHAGRRRRQYSRSNLAVFRRPLTLQIDSCVPMVASVATRALRNGIRRQRPPTPARQVVQLVRPAQRQRLVIVTDSVGSRTGAETCTSFATAERVSRKRRTVGCRRFQSRIVGLCGRRSGFGPSRCDSVGMGSPTEPRRRSQETTFLRAVPRRCILGNSHCRASGAGKNPCANLTCVNSSSPTFHYGAEVWDCWIGGSKWKSV
jgi:hypothetical protein